VPIAKRWKFAIVEAGSTLPEKNGRREKPSGVVRITQLRPGADGNFTSQI
jgi:hypothetical protein